MRGGADDLAPKLDGFRRGRSGDKKRANRRACDYPHGLSSLSFTLHPQTPYAAALDPNPYYRG
jgi:hypothetical protein